MSDPFADLPDINDTPTTAAPATPTASGTTGLPSAPGRHAAPASPAAPAGVARPATPAPAAAPAPSGSGLPTSAPRPAAPAAPAAPQPQRPAPTQATSATAPPAATQAPPTPAPQGDSLPDLVLTPTATSPSASRTTRRGPATPATAATPGVEEILDDDESGDRIPIDDVLDFLMRGGGSDLHLTVNMPPAMRVRGEMQVIPGYKPLTPEQVQKTMYSIMSAKQTKRFEEKNELDFAYALPNGAARFRVNVFRQMGSVGGVMRIIPSEIMSLQALNLPEVLAPLAHLERGLVLVTGPTGSGKSTTLASILDYANRTRRGHIMTIEDPVEFRHQHRGCVVNQREVGEDTESFAAALKSVLRQDPDIILVGEMRDLETISVALSAAETGHLVLGTLHTKSAQDTVTRIVDVFPANQQAQIRTQLAGAVQAIVCQALTKTLDGNGRQAAVEILLATPAIRAMIRDDKLQQIPGTLQANGRLGMRTLNQDLAEHVKSGRIAYEVALEKCTDVGDLNDNLGGPEKGAQYTAQAKRRLASGPGNSQGSPGPAGQPQRSQIPPMGGTPGEPTS